MRSLAAALAILLVAACGGGDQTAQLKEVQRVKAGSMEVVLLAPGDSLKKGKGNFALEFRNADGELVDVGSVMVGASMPMAGMAPMIGGTEVKATPAPGRYELATDFSMAGSWQMTVEWDGPKGHGSARMPGTVR